MYSSYYVGNKLFAVIIYKHNCVYNTYLKFVRNYNPTEKNIVIFYI